MALLHSPLDKEHRRLGAKLVDFGGWEMPLAYSAGTVSEHLACRNDAVAFDVSHLGTVRVEGPEAFDLLQRSLTNDLNKIAPGKAQYTHLLDENGSVTDDIIVWWVDAERFDVMPNASNTTSVRSVIGGTDVTSTRAIIAVQGPNARAKVARVSKEASEVPHFGVIKVQWRGVELVVSGTGYTGEDGLEIAVPSDSAAAMWEEIVNSEITPAGLGARDTLRLEAGLPLHGHELGEGISSLKAGLGWVVSWDKGDFRGRDALEKQKESGLSHRLKGLVTEGRQPPREGNSVLIDGNVVGTVTSGNFSPVLGHGIAMAFLPVDTKPGTRVEIDVRGRTQPAKVVRLPFVSNK